MRPTRCNNGDLLLINIVSTCFGHLYVHRQENRLRSTAYGCLSCYSCCDAGKSGGELCALCADTHNYRQWNAVGSPDDGHKDARNMLRYFMYFILLTPGEIFAPFCPLELLCEEN